MYSRIKKWIKENSGVWNPETNSWDFPGDIIIPADLVENGRLLIRFGVVGGGFKCSENQLTSLEGCPKEIGGDFYCYANKLTSLEGCPKKVKAFYCFHNKLTSLKGCPEKVSGGFYCCYNRLSSLEGAPKEVGGCFDCSNNKLITLEDTPKKVGEYFNCTYNPLESVSGIFDSRISDGFYISDVFLNLQSDESNQFLVEAMNILKNRFKSVQNKLESKFSRESLEELEDILKTAAKLKFNI